MSSSTETLWPNKNSPVKEKKKKRIKAPECNQNSRLAWQLTPEGLLGEETDYKRTEARGELVVGQESVAVGIEGIEHVLQLLWAERELAVQPLFSKTQNTAAVGNDRASRTLTVL